MTKIIYMISAALVCAVFLIGAKDKFSHQSRARDSKIVHSVRSEIFYEVSAVIDGDTFVIDVEGRDATIRMLGIDTPEVVDPRKKEECYGRESSKSTASFLSDRYVRLEFSPNREKVDRYGRLLAYVFRDDGLFINLELLKNGFAREYTVGKPYSRQGEFKEMENEAKNLSAGMWGACAVE